MSTGFVGRADPVRAMREWLSAGNPGRKLSIASVSGPGGIGKTFFTEHVFDTLDLDDLQYLRLSIRGTERTRSLADIVAKDLIESTTQIPRKNRATFSLTRKAHRLLAELDDAVRAEMNRTVEGDSDLAKTIKSLLDIGVGISELIPHDAAQIAARIGKRVDAKLVADAVQRIRESRALREQGRIFSGMMPDLFGRGERNALRRDLAGTLADRLVGDLSALLWGYRKKDRGRPTSGRLEGRSKVLITIDDYEHLRFVLAPPPKNDRQASFLPELLNRLRDAAFESFVLICCRDQLKNTHVMWEQHYQPDVLGEIQLQCWTGTEARDYVRSRGIADESIAQRIVADTQGYPFLLVGEVEDELQGGRTAVGLQRFFDRTTRWMTAEQAEWLQHLCFLESITIESIESVLPGEDAQQVQAWFEREASLRSPHASDWRLLPVIRSRILAYVENRSPRRFAELRALGERCTGAPVP